MASVPDIAIVGPGKVGTALGVLAARAGLTVAAVGGGRRAKAQESARAIGSSVKALGSAEAAALAGLVLLTVPDDAIEPVCGQLAEAKAFRPGAIVAHCCGALSSEVLASARLQGCEIGSLHPLQTFPSVQAAVEKMPGTYFFLEGTAGACTALEALAAAVGGRPVRTTPQNKALYHASACMASNYMVSLLDAASGLLATAVPESAAADRAAALAALQPLLRATLDNVLSMGAEAALTGPISRGDVATVKSHLAALSQCMGELVEAYKAMGKLTVDLALRKGTIGEPAAEALLALLE